MNLPFFMYIYLMTNLIELYIGNKGSGKTTKLTEHLMEVISSNPHLKKEEIIFISPIFNKDFSLFKRSSKIFCNLYPGLFYAPIQK